jgi:cytochrome d ubiquinol oxidase subunit II
MDLNTIWFLLVGVLVGGYAILDGFDLGVGVLHLFARSEQEKRINLNAIGPVWDGNEVWLLTGGGALFAAFPVVYATVFSGFYLALVLLLVALMFRAVSLEFRGKVESPGWRKAWDWAFGLGSLLPAILFGVAFGNVMRGVPIDAEGMYTGGFFGLLNPYAVLVGVLSLAMFIMHGAIFMTLKTDGELRDRMAKIGNGAWVATLVLYVVMMIATFFAAGHLFDVAFSRPLFWGLVVVLMLALISVPVSLKGGKYMRAFVGSAVGILGMLFAAAASLYPRIVPSSIDLANSLDIYNSASTQRTQTVMLIIALVGMPIVIGYTAYIYWIFRGKPVISDHEGY